MHECKCASRLHTTQYFHTGADPGFSFGSGGQKMMCIRMHSIMSMKRKSIMAGVQGRLLKGPWKLHVSGFLLCYLRHTCILKYSHTKWDFKKVIKIFYSFFFFFFFFFGGGGGGRGRSVPAVPPPPQICHCLHTHTFIAYWICKFTFTNPVTKKTIIHLIFILQMHIM